MDSEALHVDHCISIMSAAQCLDDDDDDDDDDDVTGISGLRGTAC